MPYFLSEEARIVGASGSVVLPKQVRRKKPRILAVTSADIPKILMLDPYLVQAFSDLPAQLASKLSRAGVAILAYNQRVIAGILEMIRHLGTKVDQWRRASNLADHYAQRLALVVARTAAQNRPEVTFRSGMNS